MLLDFQASVNANAHGLFQIQTRSGQRKKCQTPSLSIQEFNRQIVINTRKATFVLNRQVCKPFDRVCLAGVDLIAGDGSSFRLTDEAGREYFPHIHDLAVETTGPLRATVCARGELKAGSGFGLAHFVARLSFHAGSGLVAIQMTLHNPRAARHVGIIQLEPAALNAAKAAAAIMGMNNIYYRFVHLAGGDYKKMPARLRMNVMANPGVEKVDFELWSLAVSAINGCGMCIESHEHELRKAGLSAEQIQAAVRVAAVVHAVAAVLDGEGVAARLVAAA